MVVQAPVSVGVVVGLVDSAMLTSALGPRPWTGVRPGNRSERALEMAGKGCRSNRWERRCAGRHGPRRARNPAGVARPILLEA